MNLIRGSHPTPHATAVMLGVILSSGFICSARTANAAGAQRGAVIDLSATPYVPTALDSVAHPWPGIALTLTAVGTAIPIVAMTRPGASDHEFSTTFIWLATEVVTPASGHLYAGLGKRALEGMTVRAVGLGMVAAGSVNAGLWDSSSSSDVTWGAFLVVLGGTVMAASAAWDVISVSGDVERRNADWLSAHTRLETRLLPESRVPAIALTARF
jgi:hypothetical protein